MKRYVYITLALLALMAGQAHAQRCLPGMKGVRLTAEMADGFYCGANRHDAGYAFFIVRETDRALVGAISLSNVRRGVAQTASVGYWIGAGFTRQGFASRALAAVATFGFDELRLYRIEAACMPSNAASLGVLARCGFRQEGLARRYLRINGAWEDHILHALLTEDARP